MKKLKTRWQQCRACPHAEPRRTRTLRFQYPDRTEEMPWYDPFCSLAGDFQCYTSRDHPCPLEGEATIEPKKATQATLRNYQSAAKREER